MSKLIIIKPNKWNYQVEDGEKVFLVSDEEAVEIKEHIQKTYFK